MSTFTGKETLRDALEAQNIFPGYDAVFECRRELSLSGASLPEDEILGLPLDGFLAADIETQLSAKNELCIAVYIEHLKDEGFRGTYPTSLSNAEKRIRKEYVHNPTESLAECEEYLDSRREVLENYLDGIIEEIEEGATEEYMDMVETDDFAPTKGDTVKDLDSKVKSALGELLSGAEDFYIKALAAHLGMPEEDARHFGLPVEEAVRKEDKEIRAKALPQSDVTDNGKRELWINCGESFLYFMTQKDTIKEAMKEFLDRLDSIGVNHDNFGWSALELRAGNTDPDNYYRVIESCGPGYPGRWEKEKTAKQKRGNTR